MSVFSFDKDNVAQGTGGPAENCVCHPGYGGGGGGHAKIQIAIGSGQETCDQEQASKVIDYTKLIKDLRENEYYSLELEAADAIERLLAERNALLEEKNGMI